MFVNLKLLKKKAESVAGECHVRMHPLLKAAKLTAATKAAYVNGCILAAIVNSGKPTEMGRKIVCRIAQSLKVPMADVKEAFANAASLVSDREKQLFIEESLEILKDETVSRYFMSDFKNVLTSSAPIAGEALEFYNYVGMILFETEDWREKMSEGWREEKRKKAKALKRQREIKVEEDVPDHKPEKSVPRWWDPLPVKEVGENHMDFMERVSDMVERRKRDIHAKFRSGEIDRDEAQRLMDEADDVEMESRVVC